MPFGTDSGGTSPCLEYLHLPQVSDRQEPRSNPTNAHFIDKDHSADKEAGGEGLNNMTKVTQPENKSGGV